MNRKTLIERWPTLEMEENAPLSAHTTFRVGGPAALIVFPENVAALAAVLGACAEEGISPLILGNGSNVLAPDEGLDRVVICTKNMTELRVDGTAITVGAGCTMAKLANAALNAGLTGLEFAHGIPGTVGGGTVMNAGAYGGELKDVITEVRCLTMDGTPAIRRGEELDFGYRHSCFDSGEFVIVSVSFALSYGDPDMIRGRMDELAAKRRASQPLEYPSAGSTFKRPAGHYAAKLIQDCGLKGRAVGGAQVSMKHAGFVINTGGATCSDILQLIQVIKDEVYQQTAVALELEVKLLS